jgi:hypothetical protein
MNACRLISGTGERTSVGALSCRLSTIDRPEYFRNAGGVADDLGRSTVEDRCCAVYNRCPVHRDAIE